MALRHPDPKALGLRIISLKPGESLSFGAEDLRAMAELDYPAYQGGRELDEIEGRLLRSWRDTHKLVVEERRLAAGRAFTAKRPRKEA